MNDNALLSAPTRSALQFIDLTLLVGWQEEHLVSKNLLHKYQRFVLGTLEQSKGNSRKNYVN